MTEPNKIHTDDCLRATAVGDALGIMKEWPDGCCDMWQGCYD